MFRREILWMGWIAVLGGYGMAFDGHRVDEGPLIAELLEIPAVEDPKQATEVVLRLENSSHQEIQTKVQIELVDDWETVGPREFDMSVPGRGHVEQKVAVICPGRAFSALYPIHAWIHFQWEGKSRVAHPVLIFEVTGRPEDPDSETVPGLERVSVVMGTPLELWKVKDRRVRWHYLEGRFYDHFAGWSEQDPVSKASLGIYPVSRGDIQRESFAMHPPWVPGPGTIYLEYLLELPKIRPLILRFHNAIRDHTDQEPPSDGVTFRVWVNQENLFENHTSSKTWVQGEVDLSDYAGQEILLGLESHPGPNNDTTCDQAFWGDVVLFPGRVIQVEEMDMDGIQEKIAPARDMLRHRNPERHALILGEEVAFVAWPGDHGILDGLLGFVYPDKELLFQGLAVEVEGMPAIPVRTEVVEEEHGWTFLHEYLGSEEGCILRVKVFAQEQAVRVRLDCSRRVVNVHVGPFSRKARRIYAGHGWIWEEPAAWRLHAGGHTLSTSHVGFDFENGISLVQASDVPPLFLDVNPGKKHYALHTRENATLTLVPSTQGAFDAAFQYRSICEKRPSASVSDMAGFFFLDIWGGQFERVAKELERCISYGMRDMALIQHVWQRWGYDYRLPDIYPPNPDLGGLEGMLILAETCKRHRIPFALHDNYIDFYPDAEGFTYDHVYFTENGQPHQAWYNEGRDALSYKWRPDRILPFLKRNLALIKASICPTAYFVDVFASQPCVEYYDIDGHFHSVLECQARWGETFETIRNTLGGAFTCSEAGHDHLVGWLDGADCQCLGLGRGEHRIFAPGGNWERIPWFDAVLHDRFVLYGVGYSVRYQGGRSRESHGIYSDDYRTCELLMGHALMSDYPVFQIDAVRKYWHAQAFVRSLAMRRMDCATFEEDDIHRQTVKWDNQAVIHVNRGETDWEVQGHVLPQYGCWGRSGEVELSIERLDGYIVERSSCPEFLYVDGRTAQPGDVLPVRPVQARVETLDEKAFHLLVHWEVEKTPDKDLCLYVHFDEGRSGKEQIAFQGDHRPSPPTFQWEDGVVTGQNVRIAIPETLRGCFAIRLGLWDPKEGIRYASQGPKDATGRSILGDLRVDRDLEGRLELNVQPLDRAKEDPVRRNPEGTLIDFGWVVTSGGLRLSRTEQALIATPLPSYGPFEIRLRPRRLPEGWGKGIVRKIRVQDSQGVVSDGVVFEVKGEEISWRHDGESFAYLLEWAR